MEVTGRVEKIFFFAWEGCPFSLGWVHRVYDNGVKSCFHMALYDEVLAIIFCFHIGQFLNPFN